LLHGTLKRVKKTKQNKPQCLNFGTLAETQKGAKIIFLKHQNNFRETIGWRWCVVALFIYLT
jgi:hypothetical protein